MEREPMGLEHRLEAGAVKEKAAAKRRQGYKSKTPMRCETCIKREGHFCGLGGFQVAMYGACVCWKEGKKEQGNGKE